MIFTITQQHIDLLQNAYLRWEDCEFGAPAIDPKRPYGNSYVYGDIAEILNIKPQGEDNSFTDEQQETMLQLHKETLTALIIFLSTGVIKPGTYQYQDNSWQYQNKE